MHLTLIPTFAALMFVWWTQDALPPVVASHFNAQGRPDGYTDRADYVAMMMLLMAAFPLGAALLGALFRSLPDRAINIPRRDYWLSPDRRQDSLNYLSGWLQSLSLLGVALLAFTHYVLLKSNQDGQAHLELTPLLIGTGVFLAGLTIWILALHRRFARPPN